MVFHLEKNKRKTAIAAGIIGNIMEWYDFALYGYMASIISKLFFPSDNQVASLLATYGVFAAGFVMRPLGSLFFGWLGDTASRTKAMFISVAMMAIPTFTLGILPVYDSIGILAPILLILIRLLQGFSVGGEFSSSVTYLVETAPKNTRGLSGSYANVGSIAGMLIGSGLAALTTNIFNDNTLMSWGWRLPFLFGGVLGVVGIWLRKNLSKSAHFQKHDKERDKTSPIKEAFTENIKETIQAILVASSYGSLFYISLVFLPNWANQYLDISLGKAMIYNTVAMVVTLFAVPLMGWISDKFMRRSHFMALSIAILGITGYPLLSYIAGQGMAALIIVQIVFSILISVLLGVAPATFVELFPAKDRLSGYSVAYNVGLGIVGGSTPMISTWLISKTGSELSLGFFVIFMAIIGVVGLIWMKDRSREKLR